MYGCRYGLPFPYDHITMPATPLDAPLLPGTTITRTTTFGTVELVVGVHVDGHGQPLEQAEER